ncbi:PilZ domain-containing protein [Devosia sp. XJ19-1]|uniref:PilZ domain-containing protein n=1 Tax=Devosia ureilytica TaxID=2952754 RepID=A0A9Q4FRE8_9HYPH|nr:PilZ domain-containing protein [Devosia ureilytica]MCP8882353.1 PilZ domain-containing protein [Devosia ureilytica]MCP8885760.1 PilZ domain-containing protein [Devosia ureilytica]
MSEDLERPTIALHGITTVAGRYVIGAQPSHPGINLFACRLRMICSDSLRMTAPVIPQIGEPVSVSFASFGTLTGTVARQFEDGFEIGLEQSAAERDKLNSKITNFSENLWTTTSDRRSAQRVMPSNPRTVIARPDNWSQPCLIVDYSISGAAVSAAFQPAVGEIVTVGRVTGEVVRLFDFGFAVRFFEPQSADNIEGLLEAPEEWRDVMRRTFRAV